MMTASCNEAADWAAAGASGGPAAASSWCVNVVPGRRAKAWGQDPNAGRDALSKASFEVGLVEAELLGLFQRIGPQAHRPVVADDLSVRRLVKIFRSEEHTSELQSLMRISYAVFCLKKKKSQIHTHFAFITTQHHK